MIFVVIPIIIMYYMVIYLKAVFIGYLKHCGQICSAKLILYFTQKQLPRKMKSRLVIMKGAGYIFWQLFLRRL